MRPTHTHGGGVGRFFDGLGAFAARAPTLPQNNAATKSAPKPSASALAFVQKTMDETGETEFYEFVRALFWDKVSALVVVVVVGRRRGASMFRVGHSRQRDGVRH